MIINVFINRPGLSTLSGEGMIIVDAGAYYKDCFIYRNFIYSEL